MTIVVGILQFIQTTCRTGIWMKRVLSILPQFALPSAIFSLALKDFLAPSYHTCIVCPKYLTEYPNYFVAGAKEGTEEYHPDLPASCIPCNATEFAPSCYDAAAPVSAMSESAAGPEVRGMLISAIAFPLLAVLLDMALSLPGVQRFCCSCFEPSTHDKANIDDPDILAEEAKIRGQAVGTDMVEARGLRKVFNTYNKQGKRFKKSAVKNMWFGIKRGEVFGFLGVNGAGKSSVFKMLSGDFLPSTGTASMAGRDILTEQIAVRRLIGYCAQHNALLPRLTVREHLRIFGLIKGVHGKRLKSEIDEKLNKMDLIEFADKSAGSLSGGNQRKLCVAIALIGQPPIIFLDEPSAGMDPVAKRFMWSLISEISTVSGETTIILTTHSMEECSALCTRLAIMVDGRLRCLGTEQHLKKRYGRGYQLEVRLAELPVDVGRQMVATITGQPAPEGREGDELGCSSMALPKNQLGSACLALGNPNRAISFNVPGSSSWVLQDQISRSGRVQMSAFLEWWHAEDQVAALTAFSRTNFSATAHVVEQHAQSIRLSLPFETDTAKTSLAKVFGLLEQNKETLQIAEYCVGQTTLEQIFLGFAAEQEGAESGQAQQHLPQAQAVPMQGGAALTSRVITLDASQPLGLANNVKTNEIESVTPGGQAERAGIKLGDMVTALEGIPCRNDSEFMRELAQVKTRADTLFKLTITGQGGPIEATIVSDK
jgi:ABC-type multidrug transport system ATPase subunit